MAGNKEGAAKARDKNLASDPNFYANIGSKSWVNPDRSHETGFALLAKKDKEKHIELSKKGGRKTKADYKTSLDTETQESRPSGS